MNAEVITIGDELLIGKTVDTNATFIASQLDKIGIEVIRITSVRDQRLPVLQALKSAENADVVIITGGLGPTSDDITKVTFCEYFEDVLVFNKEISAHIQRLFKEYLNKIPNSLNDSQALIPSKAHYFENRFGTAPGILMEKNHQAYILLPGVPHEMKHLMQEKVVPYLEKKYHRPFIVHKTIYTVGIGESDLAKILEDWESDLPEEIKLAYLPAHNGVKLRLTTKGVDKIALQNLIAMEVETLKRIIGESIISEEGEETLEEIIANLLVERGKTLALAESCTGGHLAKQITRMPGASKYFRGGIIPYATEMKHEVLGVSQSVLDEKTAVSEEVAGFMAQKAKEMFQTDYAISTTGIAGPEKGDAKDEVGVVFIGVASPKGVFVQKFNFGKHRERVIKSASNKGFELLKEEILKN